MWFDWFLFSLNVSRLVNTFLPTRFGYEWVGHVLIVSLQCWLLERTRRRLAAIPTVADVFKNAGLPQDGQWWPEEEDDETEGDE